jgi:hypothetical protein
MKSQSVKLVMVVDSTLSSHPTASLIKQDTYVRVIELLPEHYFLPNWFSLCKSMSYFEPNLVT